MEEKSRSRGWCGWFVAFIVLAAVALAVFFTIRQKQHKSDSGAAPVPGPPGAVAKKYADALKVATQFLEIQKCTFSSLCFKIVLLDLFIMLMKCPSFYVSSRSLSYMCLLFG